MTDFPDHTRETAPASAQPTLDAAQKTYGMIPNLFRKMAEAPAALDGYWHLARAFDGSSFSPIEQQVVLIAASVRNECTYCVAVHSSLADMARARRPLSRPCEQVSRCRMRALRPCDVSPRRWWTNADGCHPRQSRPFWTPASTEGRCSRSSSEWG